MKNYSRIIFVCTGNTCRSPMAEVLLKSKLSNDNIEVMSRGISVFCSEPASHHSITSVSRHGLSLDGHLSRQLTYEDLTPNTLILTMTASHKAMCAAQFGDLCDIYRLGSFVGTNRDVSDPFGGSLDIYERCFDELDEYTDMLLELLDGSAK